MNYKVTYTSRKSWKDTRHTFPEIIAAESDEQATYIAIERIASENPKAFLSWDRFEMPDDSIIMLYSFAAESVTA